METSRQSISGDQLSSPATGRAGIGPRGSTLTAGSASGDAALGRETPLVTGVSAGRPPKPAPAPCPSGCRAKRSCQVPQPGLTLGLGCASGRRWLGSPGRAQLPSPSQGSGAPLSPTAAPGGV